MLLNLSLAEIVCSPVCESLTLFLVTPKAFRGSIGAYAFGVLLVVAFVVEPFYDLLRSWCLLPDDTAGVSGQ